MDVDVPVLAGTLIVPQSLFSSFKSKKVNVEIKIDYLPEPISFCYIYFAILFSMLDFTIH